MYRTVKLLKRRSKVMKKLILTLILSLCLILASCGNMNLGFGNYTFCGVHIDTYHHTACYTVETWNNSETGIEVKTKEVGTLFLSEGTYILYENECPICSQVSNDNE